MIADVRDMTERLAALSAVGLAQEQHRIATEVNRVRDQFLTSVSHELRTPLASILGFCELMADAEGLDPEVQRFVSVVTRNARREARLVEDLLMLVPVEQGGLSIHAEPTDLTSLVGDAVDSARLQARAAGIDLGFDGAAGSITVVCDPDRIGQALDNVISNALKFTPAGGSVRVVVEGGATTATVTVADTGMGIDDPETSHVFERFYRSPRAVARAIPGVGVGLSIASAIAAAHHGSLQVAATGPQGTTFVIELPLDHPSDPSLPAD